LIEYEAKNYSIVDRYIIIIIRSAPITCWK